jgi:tetratricopeptide (TPR) repeat protein
MRRFLCLFFLLVIPLCLLGCRSSKESEEAKKKVAELAGVNLPEVDPSLFPHPIDHAPEGRMFRVATRALDNGKNDEAFKIRDELKTRATQFHPLATAIDAIAAVKQGRLDQALRMAEELSSLQIMQPESYVIAGEVFQMQNRLAEARNAFEAALAMNPAHIRAHLWIGTIYYDTGAMRLATNHLRKAAELEPNEVNALLLSGKIFQDYEQYEDAILDYKKAAERLTAEDKKVGTKIKIAECLVELRKLDEAKELLSGLPSTPNVLAERAKVSETMGQFEDAAKFAKETIAIAPNHPLANLILGRIALTERRWQDAKDSVEKMVVAMPYDHESRLIYGRALVGLGETEKGQSEIKRATELKDTFLKFADLHQEAIQKPDDPLLRVQLGKLAEDLGKIDLARSWYRAALGLDTQNAEAAERLKKLTK